MDGITLNCGYYIIRFKIQFGPVVQLVRMPACHAGGRRFESVPGRHYGGVPKLAKGDGL